MIKSKIKELLIKTFGKKTKIQCGVDMSYDDGWTFQVCDCYSFLGNTYIFPKR